MIEMLCFINKLKEKESLKLKVNFIIELKRGKKLKLNFKI
jgi:hypothetical protein